MSTSTSPTTFVELYTELLNRVRVDTSVTAVVTQSKRYINIALMDMHIGFVEKLMWAERDATLLTQPKYTTGTVAINKGSTSLVGTLTLWNTNNAFGVANARVGGKIAIGLNVYTVSAVASDTGITLAEKFVDDDATGESYTYFEDEYALAVDFLRPIDVQKFSADIQLIGRTEFRRRYPRNNIAGKVVVATILDKAFGSDAVPVRKIRFHRPPEAAILIPYAYITKYLAVTSSGVEQESLVSDTDEPIVPLHIRSAIVLNGLSHWYRDKKDDNRARDAKTEYTDLMLRTVINQEVGQGRPQFQPRVSHYYAAARRPYSSGRAGRYVAGSAFDERR